MSISDAISTLCKPEASNRAILIPLIIKSIIMIIKTGMPGMKTYLSQF